MSDSSGIKAKIKKILPKKVLAAGLPAWHRVRGNAVAARFGYPGRRLKVIGVTGTNGKTTSSAYIDSILRAAGYKVGAYTTVYTRIGDEEAPVKGYVYTLDPIAVHKLHRRALRAKVDYFVQEVTSQALHQSRVAGLRYEAALFTNLTYEHMDYHKTMEHYAHAKGLLFRKKPNVIAVNIDDEWGAKYFAKFPAGRRKLLFGQSEAANARLKDIKLTTKGGRARLEVDYKTIVLDTKLVGEYNLYNAAGAACVCYGLGVPITAIEKGIRALTVVYGRVDEINLGQNFQVFSDYAHTPDGIERVLESLKKTTKGRLMIVQSVYDGRDPNKWSLLGEASAKFADLFFVTDEEAASRPRSDMRRAIISGIKRVKPQAEIFEIEDRYRAIEEAIFRAGSGDTILIVPQGPLETRGFYGFNWQGSDHDYAKKALKLLINKH